MPRPNPTLRLPPPYAYPLLCAYPEVGAARGQGPHTRKPTPAATRPSPQALLIHQPLSLGLGLGLSLSLSLSLSFFNVTRQDASRIYSPVPIP